MPKPQTIEHWIGTNVEKSGADDCWNAIGRCYNQKGWHVAFKSGGKRRLAHRAAWVLANGDIPEGMCVCHKCDNPKCCNPSHLFLGTQSDNASDMWAKKRGNPGGATQRGIKRGPSVARSLSHESVLMVFEMYRNNNPQKTIASLLSITDVAVSNILTGKTYEEYEPERLSIKHLLGRGVKKKLAGNASELLKAA